MSKLKKILYVCMLTIAVIFTYVHISKGATVEITTETLNLRAEPSTDSNIVALISIGEECEVLGEEGDWYEVQYGEYIGYISKEYAELVGDSSDSNSGGNDSNVDDNQSGTNQSDSNQGDSSTAQNTTTNSGSEDNTEQTNSQAENNSQTGDQTTESTQTTIANATATTTGRTSVRITPLINSSVIDTLANNTEVTVINQINGWAFIQTDEISGWVREDLLEIQNSGNNQDNNDNASNPDETNDNTVDENTGSDDNTTSDFTETTMYTTDFVNIRKGPSTSADKVMVVEQNTALKVVGESGDWYEVETSEGRGYVLKELLSEKEVAVTNRGNIDRTKEKAEEEESNTSSSQSGPSSNTSSSNSSSVGSSSSSATASKIVSYAKKFLGVPYVYGGASPSGFDCSGFTMYVYDNFGISMRHGAQAQAKLGKEVKADKTSKSSLLNNLQDGDLVFFLDYETMDEIGHCGIYIGDGNFIHASSGSGYCVKINSLLPGEYYNTRYCAARRIL